MGEIIFPVIWVIATLYACEQSIKNIPNEDMPYSEYVALFLIYGLMMVFAVWLLQETCLFIGVL